MAESTSSALVLLVDFALKGFFILLVALVADMVLRRSSASMRHLIWIFALAAIIVLPLVTGFAPQLNIPILNIFDNTSIDDMSMLGANLDDLETGFVWTDLLSFPLLFTVFMVGFTAVFLWQMIGRVYASRVKSKSSVIEDEGLRNLFNTIKEQLEVKKDVLLLESEQTRAPFSAGIIHPAIILPTGMETWPLSVQKSVLTHELAHIKRNDIFSRSIAQLACCLSWFNPLAWFGLKRLFVEQEIACDNYVLNTGSKPSEYAQSLLAVANVKGGRLDFAMAAIGRKEELKDRLMEILRPKRSKNQIRGFRFLAFFGFAILLLLPVYVLNLWQSEPVVKASDHSAKDKHEKKAEGAVKDEKFDGSGESSKPEVLYKDESGKVYDEETYKKLINQKVSNMKKKGFSDEEIKAFIQEAKKSIKRSGESKPSPKNEDSGKKETVDKPGLKDKSDIKKLTEEERKILEKKKKQKALEAEKWKELKKKNLETGK